MNRGVCSNECVTVAGECAMTNHNANGGGHTDPCTHITNCAGCNTKPSCGWCQDGGRNVCSETCGLTQTVDDCTNFNEHVHDGQGTGTGTNNNDGADSCDCGPGTGWDSHPADGAAPGCRAGETTSLNDAKHCHDPAAPPPPPPGIIEVGQVMHVTEENVVVNYHGYFADPILILGTPSAYGPEHLYVRVRSIDTDAKTFIAFLDVPSGAAPACSPSGGVPNTQEIFQWMLVDPGEITTSAMTHGHMEAGKGTYGICSGGSLCTPANGCADASGQRQCDHTTGFDWMSISFTNPINNAVVISQVQGHTGGDWAKTRQRNVNDQGFQVKYEEDALDAGHNTEMTGWFAVASGAGLINAIHYEALVTPDAVTGQPYTVAWSYGFQATPGLFAHAHTFDGGDPGAIRQRSISQTSASIWFEENTCAGGDGAHTTEAVGVLIVDLGVAVVSLPAHGDGGGGH